MNEKPLERLNYFNGQRLQAGDFQLEQDYHVRVRRWLNRSLYSAGIASGLEVYAVPGAPQVRVQPGLAIDPLGREIILLEPRVVDVVHDIGQGQKVSDGPYLVIRYHEDKLAQQDACCAPTDDSRDRTAAGGPSRVLAEPIVECVTDLPHEASGKILLGRIVLASGCASIAQIDTSVRRYIGEGSAAKVRQYTLEGVRDLDPDNPAKVIFHLRGRQPTSIALYLRAEQLPTLYYTEMGRHTHALSVNVTFPAHAHNLFEAAETAETGAHRVPVNGITADTDADIWHAVIGTAAGFATLANPLIALGPIEAAAAAAEGALFLADALDDGSGMNLTLSPRPFRKFNSDNVRARVNMQVDIDEDGGHKHTLPRATKQYPAAGNQVLPGAGVGTSSAAGVNDASTAYAARTGPPIHWVEDLHVEVDGVDCTQAILVQLRNRRPSGEDWAKLGGGASNHPLSVHGTGEVRLDFLQGLSFGEGEHVVVIRAPAVSGKRNGGRIHYNLYVE